VSRRDPAVAAAPALTHVDAGGRARMVDVGAKPDTERFAAAEGAVRMSAAAYALVAAHALAKGDVLAVARVAGLMAAKRTAELIPLCHPVPLSHADVELALDARAPRVRVRATASTVAGTGVEMEALTAVDGGHAHRLRHGQGRRPGDGARRCPRDREARRAARGAGGAHGLTRGRLRAAAADLPAAPFFAPPSALAPGFAA
jgi:cyclic pyranopterin phosphate synthase